MSIIANADQADCLDCPAPVAYTLPRNSYKEWLANGSRLFEPTARQCIVIEAVRQALAEGLHYTVDVRKRCAELIGITPEQDAAQESKHTRVEGGTFGMDCYYARCYLDARAKHAQEDAAATALALKPGDKLGVLVFNDYKRTSAVVVESIDGQSVTVSGSRGTSKVRAAVSPLQLRYAIDRAAEKNARKDNFAQFVARRA